MNKYQEGFRSEILNTMFNLAGNIWLKITGAYAIQFVLMVVLVFVVFLGFGMSSFMTNFGQISDLSGAMEAYSQIFESIASSTGFVIALIFLFIVIMILTSWIYYFAFILADTKVRKEKVDFGSVFKLSLSKGIFKVFGLSLIIYLMFMVVMLFAILLGTVSSILGVVAGLLFCILLNKVFLVLPAAINGQMSVGDAFKYSFQNMTFGRCAKLFLIMILFALAALVVFLVIGLISAVFTFIPVFGQLVQFAIQIFLSGFVMAVMVSGMVGLYFRYAEDIEEAGLDTDDLLVSDD